MVTMTSLSVLDNVTDRLTFLVSELQKKLAQFGSVCMNLNSNSSLRHSWRMLKEIWRREDRRRLCLLSRCYYQCDIFIPQLRIWSVYFIHFILCGAIISGTVCCHTLSASKEACSKFISLNCKMCNFFYSDTVQFSLLLSSSHLLCHLPASNFGMNHQLSSCTCHTVAYVTSFTNKIVIRSVSYYQ